MDDSPLSTVICMASRITILRDGLDQLKIEQRNVEHRIKYAEADIARLQEELGKACKEYARWMT